MPYDRRLLLDGLEPSIGGEDLDVLTTLDVDKYSAPTIARLALRIDTPASHELALEMANGPLDDETATAIIQALRQNEGSDEVRHAVSNMLAQRYPALNTTI